MLILQVKEKHIENLTPEEEFIRGTVGAKCQINFDEFWQGYEKYIVFKRAGYEPINIMVDSLENEIEIPYTILAEIGEFKIGVFGITEMETLPTLYSKDIKILYGTDTHGTTPPTYIPSEIDQLRLSKQDKLVSGENIKTVNGESILGSGNIKIQVEVDQTYDPDSTNAQSGTAVAEAVASKADKTEVNKLKGDLAYMLESSKNMLNPENNLRETYATANGIQTSSNYAKWFITEKIKVVGGNVLQCNTPVNSIVIYNADGTSDKINSVSKLYNTVDFPFTLPLTADSVILTFRMTYIDAEIMVNMGSELLPYNPFGHKEFNNSLIDLKENPVNAKLNNANTTSNFLSDFKQSLAKNVVVNYVANFDTFNSLKIGYTSKDDFSASGGYTDYFEITPTQLIMHRENVQDVAWEHGLTIEKFIGVELSFDITKNYTLTITTIGGTYTKSNYIYLGRTYYPFAVIDGTNVRNNKLSATCKDLRKNIFAFGDSYFSNASSRWMYYLQNKDSICINQYAGESSASAIVDFRTLIKHGNPKFVLWCLGMNDGTDADENTPSSKWLPHIQEVIETCEKNNIVPILATIPSVLNISHKGKNKWIRESGYYYIDFAKAVEADENGNWYSGLLSGDNIHPTEKGAKVLYSRAITDFPDLLVIS